MEKARKEAAQMERTGAIEITITEPENLAKLQMEIDGSARGSTSGQTIAVTDVLVGIHKLKLTGEDANGDTLSCEALVKVLPGAVVTKKLVLA